MEVHGRRLPRAVLLSALALVAACSDLILDFQPLGSVGPGGGSTQSTGGTGGGSVCVEGAPCYTGPSGTEGVGLCKGGTWACKVGGGVNECVGEVTPVLQNCAAGKDQACTGTVPQCIGLLRWAKRFGSASASAVAVDGMGSTIITGTTTAKVDFGGGTLQSVGAYVAKFDSSGKHLLSRSFPGTAYPAVIVTDPSNNMILAGPGTTDFGGGELSGDALLASFDPTGSHRFSKAVGGSPIVLVVTGGATDAMSNVIIVGYFYGTADFGGGPFVSPAGITAAFVAKYDSSLNHLHSIQFGMTGSARASGVGVDAMNNVFVTGPNGGATFGGTTVPGSMFVVKLDPTLNLVRATGIAGVDAGPDQDPSVPSPRLSIAVGAAGDALVAGPFKGAADFGGKMLTAATTTTDDAFVAKLDPNGSALWAISLGSTVANASVSVESVAVDSFDPPVVAGIFQVHLPLTGPQAFFDANPNPHPFVTKLDPQFAKPLWPGFSVGGMGMTTTIHSGLAVTVGGAISLGGPVQGDLQLGGAQLPPSGSGTITDAYVAAFAP
jgi:hypothetical protein